MKGIMRLSEVELAAKNRLADGRIVISSQTYTDSGVGSWNGRNTLAVYATPWRDNIYRVKSVCHFGDGYSNHEEERRMEDDCDAFNETTRALIVAPVSTEDLRTEILNLVQKMRHDELISLAVELLPANEPTKA